MPAVRRRTRAQQAVVFITMLNAMSDSGSAPTPPETHLLILALDTDRDGSVSKPELATTDLSADEVSLPGLFDLDGDVRARGSRALFLVHTRRAHACAQAPR